MSAVIMECQCGLGIVLWMFVGLLTGIWPGLIVSGEVVEDHVYCQYDKFNPKCDNDEMIVIQKAFYGRMSIGKCVKTDYGHIGCSSDVIHVLDRSCSGRRSCTVDVVDPSFADAESCDDEFKKYLEVSYRCVKVPVIDETTCALMLSNSKEELIPAAIVHTTPCGTLNKPLKVEVKTGQSINVTLIDFNPRNPHPLEGSLGKSTATFPDIIDMPPVCYHYGIIFDGKLADNFPTAHFRSEGRDICQGEARETLVMSSSSNSLLVQISPDRSSNFALKFTVVGCPELKKPKGAWVKQDGNVARVGCEHSKSVWHVVCQGNAWNGDIGNCTSKGAHIHTHTESTFSLSSAWTSLVALGVAIIIGLVILIVGLLCWRKLRKKDHVNSPNTENTPMYQSAISHNLDNSDGEMDLLTHTTEPCSPCLYCRVASEHYAPFRDPDNKGSVMPRQSIYSGTRTIDRPVMPPDLYTCNIKNIDDDERIKIMSDLNVAYDRLPQTLPASPRPPPQIQQQRNQQPLQRTQQNCAQMNNTKTNASIGRNININKDREPRIIKEI